MSATTHPLPDIINLLDAFNLAWLTAEIIPAQGKSEPFLKVINVSERFLLYSGLEKMSLVRKNLRTQGGKKADSELNTLFSALISFQQNSHRLVLYKHAFILRTYSPGKNLIIAFLEKDNPEEQPLFPSIDKKFRGIFNELGDFVFISGFNGKFLEANDTALRTLGYKREELLSLTPGNISVPREKERDASHVSAYDEYDQWAQSEQLLFGAELLARNGNRIPIEARSKIIEFEGKEAILTIARDIRERVMFEKKLLNVVMDTEEKERRRLAEELHDGMGPLLSSAKMHVDMLLSDSIPNQKKEQVYKLVKELIAESIINIREISANLMPHVLYNFGLIPALRTLISRVAVHQTLEVELTDEDFMQRPDQAVEVLLYRVISELVTNSLKHSSATLISIKISSDQTAVNLQYTDNGTGFDLRRELNAGTGMGLHNIINRIKSQQGTIKFKMPGSKGLKVSIHIPSGLSS